MNIIETLVTGLTLHVVQIMRPKGSGIYKTGTWEYITDEEKEDEKIETVVKEISAITEAFSQKPAKITRRSYHEMKSKLGGKSPAPRPSTKSRISGARVGGNKTARPSSIVTLKCSFIPQENDNVLPIPTANPSPTLSKRQEAPFTQIPPASHDSMPAPDGTTLSTSASTIPQLASNPELSTRPKLSWNAIVYGVMTNSETQDMSLSEIVEGIKERHPFYRSPDQAETLKSSPRNPLYHHPAFFKTIRPDGSGAWGLKPGAWYDEKTKKLLTTGPPNINVSSSSDPAERMTEKDGSKDIAGEPPTSSLDEVEPPSELGDRPSSPSESFRKSGGSELNEAPDNITHQKTELGRTSSVEQERELSSVIQANTTASPQEAEAIRMIQQPTILPSFESLVSRLNDQRYFEDAVHRDLVDTSMTD